MTKSIWAWEAMVQIYSQNIGFQISSPFCNGSRNCLKLKLNINAGFGMKKIFFVIFPALHPWNMPIWTSGWPGDHTRCLLSCHIHFLMETLGHSKKHLYFGFCWLLSHQVKITPITVYNFYLYLSNSHIWTYC